MRSFKIFELFLIPAIQTAAIFFAFRLEQWYLFIGLVAFLATDMLLVPFIGEQREKRFIFITAWPPLALISTVFAAIFFLDDPVLTISVICLNAALQFFYLLNLYYYLYRREKYQESSFYHNHLVIHIVTIWLAAVSLFGAEYYIDVKPRFLILPFLALFTVMIAHLLKTYQRSLKKHRLFIISSLVMMAEAIAVAHLLPNYYLMNASIILVLDALLVLVGIPSLKKEVSKTGYRVTIILLVVVLLLILISAPLR